MRETGDRERGDIQFVSYLVEVGCDGWVVGWMDG